MTPEQVPLSSSEFALAFDQIHEQLGMEAPPRWL